MSRMTGGPASVQRSGNGGRVRCRSDPSQDPGRDGRSKGKGPAETLQNPGAAPGQSSPIRRAHHDGNCRTLRSRTINRLPRHSTRNAGFATGTSAIKRSQNAAKERSNPQPQADFSPGTLSLTTLGIRGVSSTRRRLRRQCSHYQRAIFGLTYRTSCGLRCESVCALMLSFPC